MKKSFILYCLIFLSSCFVISGSYPYAEYYRFDIPRDSLILRVKELKKNNPQYNVITTLENGKEGIYPDHYNNNFYICYFYIKSIRTTMHCVINVSNSESVKNLPAEIGFSGVTTSDNFASWKTINTKELSKEENLKLKKVFETVILNKLGSWKKESFLK